MNKVLEGIKVVELTTHASAPMAGRILADMGADIIKIEPLWGDPQRAFGNSVSAPVGETENPCFQLENANKRGIALDLKKDEGREILFKLLRDANIFITNTRMAALKTMKLTYEDLRPRFPHLIYGHLSGYGLKGEDAEIPGFDITAFWARGGGIADFPTAGNAPMMTPYAVGDHAGSLAMASGVLGALNKQTRTGEGDFVLISLFGVAVFINSLMITPAQEAYGDKWPKSKYVPMTPICTTYECKDGEMLTLTILSHERDWEKFCKCIGHEELIDVKEYNQQALSKLPENSEKLVKLIGGEFLKHDRDYWIDRLKKFDLPFGKTQHLKDVSKDPMAWANGYLSEFTYDSGNTTVMPNTPIQFKENAAQSVGKAPYLGEHTREVLRELGYGDEDIASLVERKSVGVRD